MPFKSVQQRKFMWAVHPDIAKRWTKKYGSKIVPSKDKKSKNLKYGTIKHGKIHFLIGSKQDIFLHARKLPHSHVTISSKGKIIKRY